MFKSPPPTLKYTRARIYFTYSFAIQMDDSFTVDVADVKEKSKGFAKTRQDSYRNPLHPVKFLVGTPDSRSGLAPHIKFRDEDNDSAAGPAADSATDIAAITSATISETTECDPADLARRW